MTSPTVRTFSTNSWVFTWTLIVPGGAPNSSLPLTCLTGTLMFWCSACVLKLLPEEWSLPLLRPFLCGVRWGPVCMHGALPRFAVGLARAQNLQLQHDRVSSHDLCFYFQCQHRVKSHGAQSIHLIKIRIKIYFNVFRGINCPDIIMKARFDRIEETINKGSWKET